MQCNLCARRCGLVGLVCAQSYLCSKYVIEKARTAALQLVALTQQIALDCREISRREEQPQALLKDLPLGRAAVSPYRLYALRVELRRPLLALVAPSDISLLRAQYTRMIDLL